jgi:protein-disulfide isomerase
MPDEDPMLQVPVSARRDHVIGGTDAAVTLVEYGDFECPYCGQAYPAVKEVVGAFLGQMRFVFRHFPLTQVHPHAAHAAEAAEAAAAQRQFWEMHDLLYENQGALADDDLLAYAARLGLDLDRFQVELAQGAHAQHVRDDFMGGVRSGVNGTPTFFINGRRHDGSYDPRSLAEAVTAAMAVPRDPEAHRQHPRQSTYE